MNAYMNISVRVVSAAARAQIQALQAQVAGLQKQLAAANATSAAGPLGGGAAATRSRKTLGAWGNQMQWTGRQIQYNFTLPLVLAGAAATKFALDNERAMTRVTKVYGDQQAALEWARKNTDQWAKGAVSAAKHVEIAFANETKALGEAFEALSSHFGVQQKEVIETASAWAAAGASGVALAKSTKLSLETSVLGEMELAKATEALIAIQAQYGLSTKGLSRALAEINAIENQTGITTQGLVDGFARAAGVAREAGIDVRHLGAMLAALVPATGTAATAGNALKTIISRLMSPTGEAADVMRQFGVDTRDAAWQSSTAMERLMVLAGHMSDTLKETGNQTEDTADDMYRLSESQKQVVATVLGSRYQMNRFLVLMRELGPEMSYFEKSLDATADKEAVFAQKTRELNAVLNSSPKRLEILWYTLQNGMADAIQPMIPYILYMVSLITRAVTAFSNLSPEAQKFFFIVAIGIASVGIFMRYLGSTATLLYSLSRGFAVATAGALGLFTAKMKLGVGTVAVTTSLWGMTAALISMPFRAVSAAIGFFIGKLLMIPVVAKATKVATKGFKLLGAVLLSSLTWGPKFVLMLARMLVAQKVWAAASELVMISWWLAQIAVQNAFAPVSLAITKAWGAAQVAVLVWARNAYISGVALWASATLAIQKGWAAASLMITNLWGVASVNARALWFGRDLIFHAVWAKASGVISGAWAAAQLAITNLWGSTTLTTRAIWFGRDTITQTLWARMSARISAVWAAAQVAITNAWGMSTLTARAIWYGRDTIIQTLWARASQAIMVAWTVAYIGILNTIAAASLTLRAIWYGKDIILQKAWMVASVAILRAWTTAMMLMQVVGQNARFAATILFYQLQLAAQRTWAAVSIALERTWAMLSNAAYFAYSNIRMALTVAMWRAQLVLQRAFQIASMNLQFAWAIAMNAAHVAWGAASLAITKAIETARLAISRRFWMTLIALNMAFSKAFVAIQTATAAFLLGPWGVAIAAVIALVVIFRKQLMQIWNNIVTYFSDSNNAVVTGIINAWNALPNGVANALTAVAKIVRDAAMQIYEWFSYINPFAQHSPSLVENVTKGMGEINRQFATLKGVGGHVKAAYAAIKAFKNAAGGLSAAGGRIEFAEDLKSIAKVAPSAVGPFKAMAASLRQLEADLAKIEPRMNAQQAVVDRWQAAVDRLNYKLNMQQYILDGLTRRQQKWQDLVDEATERLDYFANVGIQGQQAMSDAIFENEMAQKRLRLEMMRIEEVNGSLDDMRSKIEAINGAQELLRGTQEGLRQKGAGSDVLSGYQAQIDKLEEQKKVNEDAASSLQSMSKRLDELQRKGEELDLVNSLQFDPLRRQIEKAANAMKELPFDQIMQGVRGANRDIEKYQGHLDKATAAVERQQAVVDRLTRQRDQLQHRLDQEQRKLDLIKDKYDAVADAISDVKSAMDGAVSSAGKLAEKLDAKKLKKKGGPGGEGYVSPAVQNFRDAAGGNFASVGGDGIPMRKNWADQSGRIKKFTENLAGQTAKVFEDLNPFTWIKEKWAGFKSWWRGVWGEISSIGADFFGSIFTGGGGGGIDIDFGSIKESVVNFFNTFRGMWNDTQKFIGKIIDAVGSLWDLFGPDLIDTVNSIGDALSNVWDKMGPEFSKFWKEIVEFGPALKGLFNIIKVLVPITLMPLIFVLKLLANIISKILGPVIEWLGDIITAAIRILRGLFQFVSGFLALFSGDFETAFAKMGAGIGNIFGGLVDAIWSTLKNGFKVILGTVWGFIEGIWEFFVWLWDKLVGHSIIPDLIEGIVWWFKKLADIVKWVWDKFVQPAWKLFMWLLPKVVALFRLWWASVTTAWSGLKALAGWLWTFVLKPIWDKVMELWPVVKLAFQVWWAGIKTAWRGLKKAADWLWDYALKPTWQIVKKLWNVVRQQLREWWPRIKNVWNKLKDLAQWLWSEVLKPVWNKVKDLWNKAREELRRWWERIKATWNELKRMGTWLWENVLRPAWNTIKDLWTKAKSELNQWWERIKNVWSKLKDLGQWIWDNVMFPVFDAIRDGWNKVKTWMEESKDLLKEPAKGIINHVITAINKVIGGLNQVAKVLPGFDWHIDLIPELAQGGPVPRRRVGGGFKTNGARAIVGEGKANWPEFVIPTDPTHRTRARALLGMAMAKIGGPTPGGAKNVNHDGVPMYGIGGWIDDKWDDVKNIGKQIKDLGTKAILNIMKPILETAKSTIRGLDPGWAIAQEVAIAPLSKLQEWSNQSVEMLEKALEEHAPKPKGGNVNVGTPDNPGGRGYWKGGAFTNRFIAHLEAAQRLAGMQIPVTKGGWRGYNDGNSGSSHAGDAIDSSTAPSIIRSLRRVGIASGDRTGLGPWGPHSHSVPGPGAGTAQGSAIWQFQDYMARGGMNQSLSSPWGLANGAIIRGGRGGVLARIGEGSNDELVKPLPRNWQAGSDSGGTHIHFHGATLEFPNIKNGDDAKAFIENIKKLAED